MADESSNWAEDFFNEILDENLQPDDGKLDEPADESSDKDDSEEDDGFEGFMELQNVAAAKSEPRSESLKRKTSPEPQKIKQERKRQRTAYTDENFRGYVEDVEDQVDETKHLTEALNSFTEMMFEDRQTSKLEKPKVKEEPKKAQVDRSMYQYLFEETAALSKVVDDGDVTEDGELSDNEPHPTQRIPMKQEQVGADLREEEENSGAEECSSDEGEADSEREDKDNVPQKKVAPTFQSNFVDDPGVIPGLGVADMLVPSATISEKQGSDSEGSESESESTSSEEVEGGWSVIKGGPLRDTLLEPKEQKQKEKNVALEKASEKKELDPKDLANALKLSMDKLQKEMVLEKNREAVLQGSVQDPRQMNWTVKNWLPGMTPGQLLELQEKGIDPQGFIEKTKRELPGILPDNPNAKVDPTKPLPSELKKLAEQAKSMLHKKDEQKPELILLTADRKEKSRSRSRSRSYSSSSSRSSSGSFSSSYYSSDYTSTSSSDYSSDDDLHYGKLGGYYRKHTRDTVSGSKSLYVWGFPPQFRSRDLQELFKRFGCYDATVVFQKDGRSRCFGFVDFSTYEEATLARFALNGIQPSREFKRKLRVTEKTKVGSKKAIAREKVRSQMKKFADQAKQRKNDMMLEFQQRNQRASTMVAQAVRQLENKYEGMQPLKDPMKQKLSLLANGILGQSVDYKAKIDIINQKIKRYEEKIKEQERINMLSNPIVKNSQTDQHQQINPTEQQTHVTVPINEERTQTLLAPNHHLSAVEANRQTSVMTPKPAVSSEPKVEGRPKVEMRPKLEPGPTVEPIHITELTPKFEPQPCPQPTLQSFRNQEYLGEQLQQPQYPVHQSHTGLGRPFIEEQTQHLELDCPPQIRGIDVPPPPPPIMKTLNPQQYIPPNSFRGRYPTEVVPSNKYRTISRTNPGVPLNFPAVDLGIVAPAFRDQTEKIGTLSHRADAPVEQTPIKPKRPR